VLQSAGVTTSLGILYALVGSIVLLPPILRRIYAPPPPTTPTSVTPGSKAHARRLRRRYRHMEPYPRLFARFKLRDPMFLRLAELVDPQARVLDVGCGFGVPAAWLLSCYPELHVLGVESELDRARVAGRALGSRGNVVVARAETLPVLAGSVETVLMLDMVHHLDDAALHNTLDRARATLSPAGRLILRTTIPSKKRLPWERRLEVLHARLRRQRCHFRDADSLSEAITRAGFAPPKQEPSAPNREETWLIARLPGNPT
jgi:SAM-dependent methyltransferase